ncbi:MAG TPA: hypothetical protein DHV62_09205, partial [Elusimicrobia bacterium]|nr:hypothetical protein [Elusimicrobiota bacterium]
VSCLLTTVSFTQQGDRFVFTQLKYQGNWDPYPEVSREILNFLRLTTSIKVLPERRVVTLDDELLFSSPFLIVLGQEFFPVLKGKEVETLNRYLKGGGIIFVDDCSGEKRSGFDKAIRREFNRILPNGEWIKLPKEEHPVFRSFYLLRTIGGRRIVNNYLEGINLPGRTAVIYSQNDLFATWVKDRLGNYLYSCSPAGETQRLEAIKLTANIFIYALTGTYKTDYIHQPFIKEKMHRR